MSVYKVPQDVEAEDKLIGPFTFRQFIYLIIVALLIYVAWVVGQIFLPLVLIPLPFILLFGAIALPLRKDQPMETYMAAIISFYLKPHKRLWEPDGIESLVEVTAPKAIEQQLTKDLSKGEAEQRLGYLAQVIDSQGWSVRKEGVRAPNSPMNTDVYYAAQQTRDMLDDNDTLSQSLDSMIEKSDEKRMENVLEKFHATSQAPVAVVPSPTADASQPHLTYNPYPTNMQQSVVEPDDDSQAVSTSVKQPSADIIELANDAELSVATIGQQANRINSKQASDEVVISLR